MVLCRSLGRSEALSKGSRSSTVRRVILAGSFTRDQIDEEEVNNARGHPIDIRRPEISRGSVISGGFGFHLHTKWTAGSWTCRRKAMRRESMGRCWCAGGVNWGLCLWMTLWSKKRWCCWVQGSPFWPFSSPFSFHEPHEHTSNSGLISRNTVSRPLNVWTWHGRTGVRAAATKPSRQSCGGV